jgi:Flp pilus assembly pilin Flp
MAQWLHNFWLEEEGQDLIEYSLLLTFIALMCLAFVFSGNTAVNGIFVQANCQLVSAETAATGS